MTKYTEEDTKFRFISPAIVKQAGWEEKYIRMERYFTDGQVLVRGNRRKRGKAKKADYLLLSKNMETPLAIVEAKSIDKSLESGLQQAIEYATILDVPFAYSSNGQGFIERDMLTGIERELPLDQFPTQEALWNRYVKDKNLTPEEEKMIEEPYFVDPITKNMTPRYYQRIAIDRTIEAVAKGQKRILLVMATGTGKTYTAFQIIWRLKKTKPNMKVLYLADRNILIDQTITDDFKPFEKVITKVQGGKLDSSYEIYMSLYQQLAGENGEEAFRQFQPEFFDLIIVDECHRGSAKEESQWRQVINYFSSAVQIGLTATPKESKDVSNITYFGEPIYTYSLKQGIEDGFLAPYKVLRISMDRDVEGWRPEKGKKDIHGNFVEDREYDQKDFDKTLIIDERTELVAKRVTQWLKENGRDSKTIIFCVDIDHAERMRQAMVNENSDIVKDHPDYIMQITGDNKEGKKRLDDFINVHEPYPTIVTTSKLLTTGVNCKTCKLIVLDSNIQSMTEFKQIIGRGTRLNTDHKKWFFTIMDFKNVTRLFSDEEFDGEPIVIIEEPIIPGEGNEDPEEPIIDGDDFDGDDWEDDEDYPDITGEPEFPISNKIRVRDVEVKIINERYQTLDSDGKLITEDLQDFTKRNILDEYATLNDFLQAWNSAEKKQAIIKELEDQGISLELLEKASGNKDYDPFDLIMHIAYDKKPLTRAERVNGVKKRNYLYQYDEVCQKVLSALLDKYMNEGIAPLEDVSVLNNNPFDLIGSPIKIAKMFGGNEEYLQAVMGLQNALYATENYAQ
ncbi:EcoAI/FtnUII family type I restriction enzme subunit R [Ignatzschineria sp. LJL83]